MRKKLLSILATTFIVISASAGEITAVTVTQNSDYTGRKNQYEPIISSKIDISGSDTKLQSVTLTLDGTTDIGDYAKVKIYSTGTDATFDERTAANATLLGEYAPAKGSMTCDPRIRRHTERRCQLHMDSGRSGRRCHRGQQT